VQDGTFAREWIEENRSGGRKFAALRDAEKQHSIEIVGAKLRGMMSWLPQQAQKPAVKPESKARPTAKVVNA